MDQPISRRTKNDKQCQKTNPQISEATDAMGIPTGYPSTLLRKPLTPERKETGKAESTKPFKEEENIMEKNLYHYTAIGYLSSIKEDGFLKLTPSDLIQPKDLTIVFDKERGVWAAKSKMSDPIKPVVWMTDSLNAERQGLELGSPWKLTAYNDKTRIRITIPMKSSYKWWLEWAQRNRMNKKWFKAYTKDMRYGTWYISESPIYLTDIAKIEDLHTGEVYYENPAAYFVA